MKKIKIFVAIPTTDSIVDSQAFSLREMVELYGDTVEFVYPKVCTRRVFHDFARNELVNEFLDTDCDLLWFLDSDITPSAYVMDLVKNHYSKWQVAGATYPVFMSPTANGSLEVVYTCYRKNPTTGNLTLSGVPLRGQEFVDGLATGCLFIKREVFEKLSKPYFEFKFKESREMSEGEDLGFARKLSELGIKYFVDYELICRHQKTVDLLDVNNYAIAYSKRQVAAYEESVRDHMQIVLKAAYDKGFLEALERIRKESEAEEEKRAKKIWTPSLITKL